MSEKNNENEGLKKVQEQNLTDAQLENVTGGLKIEFKKNEDDEKDTKEIFTAKDGKKIRIKRENFIRW